MKRSIWATYLYEGRSFGYICIQRIFNKDTHSIFKCVIIDEKYKQLRLSQGLPSYTKFIFTPLIGNQENIRISSEPNDLFPNNNISNFSIELPKSLDFGWKKNTKVSLTRISLKNKWELLPGLRIDFFIYNIGEGQKQFWIFSMSKRKKRTQKLSWNCQLVQKQKQRSRNFFETGCSRQWKSFYHLQKP